MDYQPLPSIRRACHIYTSINRFNVFAARQGHYLTAAFHPELTDDYRMHQYFVKMVEDRVALV